MSSKIGLILSLVYVAMFFLFAGDMVAVQFAYSDLDAKAVTIGYLINEHGYIDDEFVSSIEERFQVDFVRASNYDPLFGDVVDFVISTNLDPMIISKDTLTIYVERTTVIGFTN